MGCGGVMRPRSTGQDVAKAESTAQQKVAQVIRLSADTPITTVQLFGDNDEAGVYRICCLGGDKPDVPHNRCVSFQSARLFAEKQASIVQDRISFEDPRGAKTLSIVDRVVIDGEARQAGRDGRNELAFGDNGLTIRLPRAASFVRLHMALKRGVEFQVRAEDARGRVIDAEGGRGTGKGSIVTLRAERIQLIRIGAESAGLLAEICLREVGLPPVIDIPDQPPVFFDDPLPPVLRDRFRRRPDTPFILHPRPMPGVITGPRLRDLSDLLVQPARPPHITPADLQGRRGAARSGNVTLPVVTSSDRDGRGNTTVAWPGRIERSFTRKDGTVCAVVRYKAPEAAAPFDRVSVRPQNEAQEITFMGLCGVDQRAANLQARDTLLCADLSNDLAENAGIAETGRPVLLEPDTEYHIAVAWSWQAWQSEEDNDNAPAVPPNSGWQSGGAQTFKFRTADDTAALSALQDGPNEHVFDPRDMDRYLVESRPANAAIAHFTDDPVVFHFGQNHVHNLLGQYGRDFDIEIRRTDPPMQPNGNIGPMIATLSCRLQRLDIPLELQSELGGRLIEAAQELPCVPFTRPPVGGTTLAGSFPLEPLVQYDADLMARDSATPNDKIRVSASRLQTSRYANPDGMVQALGTTTRGAPFPLVPTELILGSEATLPGDVDLGSDRSFDQAMAAAGLDTLALPDSPRIIQIWQPNRAGTRMHCVGFLVDALEPLNRSSAVIVGEAVEQVDRCRLREARVDGTPFRLVRVTANATRALLVAPGGFTAPRDPDSFELIFDSYNPGKPGADKTETITGKTRIRTVPFVIEIEGF